MRSSTGQFRRTEEFPVPEEESIVQEILTGAGKKKKETFFRQFFDTWTDQK